MKRERSIWIDPSTGGSGCGEESGERGEGWSSPVSEHESDSKRRKCSFVFTRGSVAVGRAVDRDRIYDHCALLRYSYNPFVS